MYKAIFIDKDGTLIPDIPYNVNAELITLSDGAVEGLSIFRQKGYLIIIISNQSGIAKGYFKEKELSAVEQRIKALLQKNNIPLTAFYYCPHHPDGIVKEYSIVCDCRKPQPGLLLKAAEDWKIDLPNSWMIGDILNDVEAGHKAGCKTVLIDNGGETEWILTKERTPDLIAKDILDAANKVISFSNSIAAYEPK